MIIVLSKSYSDFREWCLVHNFEYRCNKKVEVISIHNIEDLPKVYGLEIQSIITLPSFYSLLVEDQQIIFRTVLSRMRL